MAFAYNCDHVNDDGTVCNKQIYYIPKHEIITETVDKIELQPVKGQDGKYEFIEQTKQVIQPVLEKVPVQQADGSVILVDMPKKNYLQPKAHLVYLKIDDWFMQVELCDEHFKEELPLIQQLKDVANKMKEMKGF